MTMGEDTLRIAQFITQYPYPEGTAGVEEYYCAGAERVAKELSEALADDGHDVHVFTSAAGRSYEEQTQNGVTVHRSPSVTAINTTQIPPTIPLDGLQEEFDIVHGHNSTPPGMLAAYARSILDELPFVITHHGGEHYEPHGGLVRRGGLFLYTRVLMETVFGHAETVVTPSAGYRAESRVLDSPPVTEMTIRNGVDVETFSHNGSTQSAKTALGFDPDEFLILYLGAHHPRKGPDVLVDAFAEFTTIVEDAHLVLAGSGDLTPQLRGAVDDHDIASSVTFPGYVSEETKPTYFTAADLFVLPSTTGGAEMFPLVILEAAAAGTPVVTTDFPTLRPVVRENEIGNLVEPGNATALAQTLADLQDGSALETYGENAREMALEHRWSAVADEYEQLYRTVIA